MTSQITWRQTITIYCWKVQADHRICSAKNLLTTKQDHKSEEDHSEDNFLAPTFENKAESPPTTLSLDESDGLIGTSKECQKYFEDLEKVVKASLEADKEQVKEEGKQILIRCLIQIKQFQKFMTGSVLYPLHRNISVWLLFHV